MDLSNLHEVHSRGRKRRVPAPFLPLLVAAVLAAAPGQSAEIGGRVSVRYAGLFQPDASMSDVPVSVALLPVRDRKVGLRSPQVVQIEVIGNRIVPPFLTLQTGDAVEFVNRDNVFHELFSVSPERPFDIVLAKVDATKPVTQKVLFDKPGSMHVFCRIHNKSYARIDVLDTPYQKMVQAGEAFRFADIPTGRWTLRLASPGAETRLIDVDALTSPPSLTLELRSMIGGSGAGPLSGEAAVERLFPTGVR